MLEFVLSIVYQLHLMLLVLIVWLYEQSNAVGVTSLIGGASDNTGSGIARRLGNCYYTRLMCFCVIGLLAHTFLKFSVLKTGLNVVLACNLPKNNPMLEVRPPCTMENFFFFISIS